MNFIYIVIQVTSIQPQRFGATTEQYGATSLITITIEDNI